MISILVVDNSPELCDVIAQYLSLQPDFEVCGVAYDGKHAVDLVREKRPDLVLLDLGLPLLDGLAVLDSLQGELPKVLVITAFSREDILQKALRKGASFCLVKPFYLSVLERTIKEVCAFKEEVILDKGFSGVALDKNTVLGYIEEFLTAYGIKKHLKGYSYLKEALLLLLDNQSMLLDALGKSLYPVLAVKFNTSAVNVEAALRGAINSAWKNNKGSLAKLFNRKDGQRRKPTTSQFLNIAKREIQKVLNEARKELLS